MSLNTPMWKPDGTKMDVAADMVAHYESRGFTREDPKAKKEPARQSKPKEDTKPKIGNKIN